MAKHPNPKSKWQRSDIGGQYTVLCVTNLHSEHPDQVATVVYQSDDGQVLSLPAEEWENLMAPVAAHEATAADPHLRALMEGDAWKNAMTGLCTIWPGSPDAAAHHLRRRLHMTLTQREGLATLLWDAAKALQWHLEPNSPDEHEKLMAKLYQVAKDMGAGVATPAAKPDALSAARARGRNNAAKEWAHHGNLLLKEAATATGLSEQDIELSRDTGIVYSLSKLERRYPQWQFAADPNRLRAVLKPFLDANASCWVIHNFMHRQHGDLEGATPKDWILDVSKPIEAVVRLATERYQDEQPVRKAPSTGKSHLAQWQHAIQTMTPGAE